MDKRKTYSMVLIALFAAIISIVSMIPTGIYIMGIPITFQTFIISLVGFTLGSKNGVKAVLMYILLGIVGLPVFSGFKGGVGTLLSVTGGYIIGFVAIVIFAGIARNNKSRFIAVMVSFIGLIICYIIGTIWFAMVSKVSVMTGFMVGTLPYIPKDVLLIVVAYIVSLKLNKTLRYGDL